MRSWLIGLILLSILATGQPMAYADVARQDIPRLPQCTATNLDEICEIDYSWTAAELSEHAGEHYWRMNDNEMVFAFQGEDLQLVALVGDVSTALHPVADDATWFVLHTRIPRVDEAILQIGFIPVMDGQAQRDAMVFYEWRGENAPPEPPAADPLQGTLENLPIPSAHLATPRTVSVYLPPAYDDTLTYPVLYMVDGQMLAGMAPFIDQQISAGNLPPLIIVGAHAAQATQRNADPRADEYLPTLNDNVFAAHATFFIEELMPWAEANYAVSTERDQRAIFGLSNGAAFAVWLAENHANLFANAIIFSYGWSSEHTLAAEPVRYYLLAGTLEPHFAEATQELATLLEDSDVEHVLMWRVAGHNPRMWQEELPNALAWVWSISE